MSVARDAECDLDTSIVRVGSMRRRHLPGVLRIERQVYPRPWTIGLYLGELALPATRTYFVAKIGPKVVGYGGLMLSLDEGHITTLAVDPTFWGHGIARRVLLQLARRAVATGARSLTLEVRVTNAAAQHLYRKFGFAPAGIRKNYYAEINEDALVMWVHDIDHAPFGQRLAEIEANLPTPTMLEV